MKKRRKKLQAGFFILPGTGHRTSDKSYFITHPDYMPRRAEPPAVYTKKSGVQVSAKKKKAEPKFRKYNYNTVICQRCIIL